MYVHIRTFTVVRCFPTPQEAWKTSDSEERKKEEGTANSWKVPIQKQKPKEDSDCPY
jgi:hypothetical protein